MQNTISLFTCKNTMMFEDTKVVFRFFQHYAFQQLKVWCSSFQEDHSKEFTRYLRLLCDWVLNATLRISCTGLTLSAQGLLVGHFNHRGESEFMFLFQVCMCKSDCALSFLHLFEAEYIDLSWEWVLAFFGINKKNISQKWFWWSSLP